MVKEISSLWLGLAIAVAAYFIITPAEAKEQKPVKPTVSASVMCPTPIQQWGIQPRKIPVECIPIQRKK